MVELVQPSPSNKTVTLVVVELVIVPQLHVQLLAVQGDKV